MARILAGVTLTVWLCNMCDSILAQAVNMNRTASACLDRPDKTLIVSCNRGHMVLIQEVVFGHSIDADRCSYHPDDPCYFVDTESVNCVGQESCSINLPSGGIGRKLPACNYSSNFIEVYYQCIQEESSFNICENSELTHQWAYIQTPNYPRNYPASTHCQLTINVHPLQHILLYIVDLDLATRVGQNDCLDWLYISSGLRGLTLCGQRQQQLAIKTLQGQNKLTLEFNSTTASNNKGFWLYYEAKPFLPSTASPNTSSAASSSTTPPPRPPGKQYTDWTTVSAPHNKHSQPTGVDQQQQSTDYLPVGGIIGGVLGTLVFVLVVLLILLIVKRRKERDLPNSMSDMYLEESKQYNSPVHHVQDMQTEEGITGPYIHNVL